MTIAFSSSMAPRTAGSKDSILPPTLLRSLSNSPFKPATSSGIAHEHGRVSPTSHGPTFNAATSPENTLIVFDWDDTFFPTSALERNRLLRIPAQKLRPQLVQQLNHLAQTVIETLTLAEQYGKVVIITNSAPGWIDTSCQAFMPMMHAKIRSYPIFAKPMNYLLTYKLDVFKREMIQGRYMNLVSVGDGIAERTATLRLVGTQPSGSHRFCKSVKLKEMPTIQQLVDQLELYMKRAEHLAKYTGDLDLRTNFGITAASRLGRTQQSIGGCTFVHLSHLGPASERDDQMLLGPYLHHQTQNRSRMGLPQTGQQVTNNYVGSSSGVPPLPHSNSGTDRNGSSSSNHGGSHDHDGHNYNNQPNSNHHTHPIGDGSILPRLISSSVDILDAPEPVRAISKPGVRGSAVGGVGGRQQVATSGDKLLRANKVIMPRTQRPGAFTPPIGIGVGRRS